MPSPDTAYREFQSTLRHYLARRLDDAEDVEDVLQDVFLRVTRNRETLEAAREPLAWLYAVAKSAMIDHLRRRRKHRGVVADGDPAEIPDPLPDMASDEFAACLVPLVRNLPGIYQDAVTFVDLDGGRQTDLAAARGLTLSTVKSRVQRGRRLLRSAILDCCKVERDALRNVTGLAPGARGRDCC